ncbi:MAG: AAA family ATPase [Methanoregulaceae archaeon]|nr:AAA family ATPase [Methanoregulaceae archaeon]
MLWIEKYRPVRFEEINGQEHAVRQLRLFSEARIVPHLLVAGPPGSGKSAAVECLSRVLYGDSWEQNTTVIDAGTLFSVGKAYLEQDERYAHIYRKGESLISNFKYIVKWFASLRPLDTTFRLLVIEDASALTREAQQALRRIMEQYSRTCRFVLCTTQPAGLIPPIASRCFPLFFVALPDEDVSARLRSILAAEDVRCPPDTVEMIVQASKGDLRKAVTLLQVVVSSREPVDLGQLSRSETAMIASAAFGSLREGDSAQASRRLESLMIEYGLSPQEVLVELRRAIRREFNDPRIARILADTDWRLSRSNNEYIQLNALAARIIAEVFC